MNQPPRRSVRPARVPTSRPRRVAGQPRDARETGADDVPGEVPVDGPVEEAVDEPAGEPVERLVDEPVDLTKRPVEPVRGSSGAVAALVAAIVVLLAVGAGELVYLGSDPEVTHLRPTAERPVQLPDLEVRQVVDQAATAAKLILSADSASYDADIAKAAATMTDGFASEFRATKADVKQDFIAQQTHVDIDISAEGVISASDLEVRVLLFLTQTTRNGTTGGVKPVQYRVVVTMEHTGKGWLVAKVDAL